MEKYSKEYFLEQFQQEETATLFSKYGNPDLSTAAREAVLVLLRNRNVSEHEIWEINKNCHRCRQLFPVDTQVCPQCFALEAAPVIQFAESKPGASLFTLGAWLLALGPLSLLIVFVALFIHNILPFRLFSDNFFLGAPWLALAATMYLVPIGIVVIVIGSVVQMGSKK